MPYKVVSSEDGHCVHKINPDGSLGERIKCHATPAEAEAHRRALYANVEDAHMQSDYILDTFIAVKPGDPIRLLRYGPLVKNGKERLITPELVKRFRLPHFKPPIKLGSHRDETPAGGFITGLEVRDDGLYALVEWNDEGADATRRGAYRYHSPEVVWEGSMEDPVTGAPIEGPLIVGDALLHTPHLGEAAALYTVEPIQSKELDMTEMVQFPVSFWEKLSAKLFPEPKPDPEPEPKPPAQAEELTAAIAERDQLKAEIEALKAEETKRARVDSFAAQLKETKIGEGAEMLAAMTDEQANWVVTKFKALSAQIDESALLAEKGSNHTDDLPEDPAKKLHVLIERKAADEKISYTAAFGKMRAEQPDLFAAAYPKQKE